jgi:hypothetical protein
MRQRDMNIMAIHGEDMDEERKERQTVRQADADLRESGAKVNFESGPHTHRRYYAT